MNFSNISGPGYNNSYSWLNLTGGIGVSPDNPVSFGPPVSATTTGGIGFTVVGDSQTPEAEVMGNTRYVYIGGQWVPGIILADAVFPGHFGFDGTNHTSGYSGDTILAAPGALGSLVFNFSQGIDAIAFQISSLSNPTFIATLQAFDGNGNLLGTYTLNTNNLSTPSSTLNGGTEGNAVGGPCVFLSNVSNSSGFANPTPGHACTNTPAPFVGLSEQSLQLLGLNQIRSIHISTNDVHGFAIGTLYAEQEQIPEPAAPLLMGIGLGMLYLGRRKLPLVKR